MAAADGFPEWRRPTGTASMSRIFEYEAKVKKNETFWKKEKKKNRTQTVDLT